MPSTHHACQAQLHLSHYPLASSTWVTAEPPFIPPNPSSPSQFMAAPSSQFLTGHAEPTAITPDSCSPHTHIQPASKSSWFQLQNTLQTQPFCLHLHGHLTLVCHLPRCSASALALTMCSLPCSQRAPGKSSVGPRFSSLSPWPHQTQGNSPPEPVWPLYTVAPVKSLTSSLLCSPLLT